jgi:anti-anti-sigma factor
MFEVDTVGRGIVLRVHGEQDDTTLPQLEQVLQTVAADVADFTVDMTKCTYINSSVISLLVKLSRKYGDKFKVVISPTGSVHMIFDVCGFIASKTFVSVASDRDDDTSLASAS